MPDRRRHRGAHPDDRRLFAPETVPSLRQAVAHLSWLLSNGYADPSALKLVGDRFNLTERQRIAVRRCACSDGALTRRLTTLRGLNTLAGATLLIDGYNLLTTVESALAGGVILAGRDGCFRDMASMHGTYRKVAETIPALHLLGDWLARQGLSRCDWLLDRPVSNSGRLAGVMHYSRYGAQTTLQGNCPYTFGPVDVPIEPGDGEILIDTTTGIYTMHGSTTGPEVTVAENCGDYRFVTRTSGSWVPAIFESDGQVTDGTVISGTHSDTFQSWNWTFTKQ